MIPFGEKIVYQVYPKSFKDSNNDGFGDLSGIVEKLDYIKDLGIDYIWITPFFLSPQKDNGYDISSYTKIDPEFGSMKDFELLVKEADKRNIGIMLDMVFNHTSTEHIWFQNALDGDKKYLRIRHLQTGYPSLVEVHGSTAKGQVNGIFICLM